MADGGIGNQSPATLFQARLNTTPGVSNTLTLLRYAGNKVVVSGQTVVIPGGGLSRLVTDHLIGPTGADSGAAGVASTLYYVYVSNQKATFSPSSIRLSATAPSFVNGVKYLGTSGNALNWRFVGWVKLNATPQFESSLSNAYIVNYYNRLFAKLFISPGYQNVDGFNQVNFPASWGPINAGTGDSFNFISNGEDAVSICGEVMCSVGQTGTSLEIGISIDGGAPPVLSFHNDFPQTITVPTSYDAALAEGVHSAGLWGISSSSPASTFYGSVPRNGLASTPVQTYMQALVPV